jgi:hypothetical protein
MSEREFYTAEPDDMGTTPERYRIVAWSARARCREIGTSARPAYVAMAYDLEIARRVAMCLTVFDPEIRYVPASEMDVARARITELEAEHSQCRRETAAGLRALLRDAKGRIAELEDWQRRARAFCRYGDNPTCNCSRCVERRYLLGEVKP